MSLRFAACLLASFCVSLCPHRAAAQDALKPPPPPTAAPKILVPWRTYKLRFSESKSVLGVPLDSHASRAHCSTAGTAFFDVSADSPLPDTPAAPDLYSVSTSAEVKHLRRTLPVEFTSLSVRDFFAGEHTLVTLLQAEQRDEARHEVRYFLSLSDHDGDAAKLLALQLRFRPLKVAAFGSGDFLVLGWDEVNLLPALALLKDDGTIRHFLDLDNTKAARENYTSLKDAEASPSSRLALEALQSAVFVPFGSQIMLTYPGTAKGIRVLSALGEDRVIPVKFPSGFVLHDALVTGSNYSLVLRVQPPDSDVKPAQSDPPPPPPVQRLLEFSSTDGAMLREFLFDRPAISTITCAPGYTISAMFLEVIPNVVHPDSLSTEKPSPSEAKQLVVANARR